MCVGSLHGPVRRTWGTEGAMRSVLRAAQEDGTLLCGARVLCALGGVQCLAAVGVGP